MPYEEYEKLVDLLIYAEKKCWERCCEGDYCGTCTYENVDYCQERLKADYICNYVDYMKHQSKNEES